MNERFLGIAANIVAAIGVIVCAVAGFSRLLGSYHVFGDDAVHRRHLANGVRDADQATYP